MLYIRRLFLASIYVCLYVCLTHKTSRCCFCPLGDTLNST